MGKMPASRWAALNWGDSRFVTFFRIALSFAYPFTALTFILVMLSSRMVFLESIPPLRYLGIALIVAGILVSSVARG